MKAADIPDRVFLEEVARCNAGHGPGLDVSEFKWKEEPHWAMTWDVASRLGFPEKVVRTKARRLIGRKLMTGCACGCRGDFELTPEGRAFLDEQQG